MFILQFDFPFETELQAVSNIVMRVIHFNIDTILRKLSTPCRLYCLLDFIKMNLFI